MSPTLAQLHAQVTEGVSSEHALFFRVDPLTIEVRTNSAQLCDKLREYFLDLVVAPRNSDLRFQAIQCPPPTLGLPYVPWRRELSKRGLKEEFADLPLGRVVHKVRTGMQFLVGSTIRTAVGDCVTNYNQVVNFINSQIIVHYLEQGWQLCHAAAVVKGDAGLAIAAAAGSGKSTLALHLLSAGLDFASNDRLLISNAGGGTRMAGIPKLPRVNPGTLLGNPDLNGVLSAERAHQLSQINPGELWALEEKYDVDIAAIYGRDRTRYFAPLRALLILTWTQNGQTPAEIVPVDLRERADLLQLVMKPAGPFYTQTDVNVAPEDTLEPAHYLAALAGVPCYEARGRADFPYAVRHCIDHLLS
jgi:HprK-related kinase B